MNHILWLSDLNVNDKPTVGSKAARLGALAGAGFPAPPGFCITQEVYREQVLSVHQAELHNGRLAQAHRFIQGIELAPALVANISTYYRQLIARQPGAVAVRSSATAEDLAQHSFAGLYESVLNVQDEPALLDAVRRCWASYWSEEAVAYRERAGVPHTEHGMAVLVQAMIQPRCAGVLFTQDPLDPEGETLMIELVHGNGETLVSGEARGERLLIDRKTRRLLDSFHSTTPLDLALLDRLVSLGLAVEAHQAGPQDIEWAVDANDQIWLLQTRPITRLASEECSQTNGTPPMMKTSFGGQRSAVGGLFSKEPAPHPNGHGDWLITYDEPFSPLGCDIAVRRYSYWVRAINDFFKTAFEPQMRLADGGFLYYKPTWRSPGRLTRLWMWVWRFGRWLGGSRIEAQYVKKILPTHQRRLVELEQPDISRLDDATLLANFNTSIELYLDFQFSSYAIGVVATTSASLLDQLCRLWLDRNYTLRALDFVSGLENLSVAHHLALHRLGQTLAEILTPAEIAKLDYPGLLALKNCPGGQRFWAELQTFLDEYGYVWADRYPRDPAWKLNQAALMASLIHAAQQAGANNGLTGGYEQQQQQRRQAIEQVTTQLLGHDKLPWRRMIFCWLLRRAERFFPYKEDRNHYVYRTAMGMRKYAQEVGRRLQARQLLPSAEDVFFLTWEEIQKVWSNPLLLGDLRPHIEHRQQAYQHSRQQAVEQKANDRWAGPESSKNGAGVIELTGDACSPGVVKGRARLISGLGELQRVQPGEIVVCGQLRPAWTSVFARAGGVVIEMGSLLSHGSTLAREYGIPAVINISGLTQIVREDDWLTVDGRLGKVVVERGDVRVGS